MGVCLFHTITLDQKGASDFLNFFDVAEEWFVHRQVERREGRFYMRAKRRSFIGSAS